jgi:hypothetical protein
MIALGVLLGTAIVIIVMLIWGDKIVDWMWRH